MTAVERESGGRFKKGVVANPFGGMPRAKVLALKKLEGLTGKAIARLEQLLHDQNGSVALGAAKEILDRNLGKVRQQVQVDVTSTHVLHLQALEELAARKRAQLIEAQAIDITKHSVSSNSNATLDGKGLREDSALTLSASDYSATVEGPRQGDPGGAAAYAPPTPDTPQNPPPPLEEK